MQCFRARQIVNKRTVVSGTAVNATCCEVARWKVAHAPHARRFSLAARRAELLHSTFHMPARSPDLLTFVPPAHISAASYASSPITIKRHETGDCSLASAHGSSTYNS